MRICEKCLGSDIRLNYYGKEEFIQYYQMKIFRKIINNEDYINLYTNFTKKEFLLCTCRTCSYSWISDPATNNKGPDS